MREIIRQLERLRGRSRAMLIVQRLSLIATAVLGALILLGVADYLLRFPAGFRLMILLAGLGGLGWLVLRHLVPTFGFEPPLTEIALRIERLIPGLSGRLASSVEFAAADVAQRNPLAARSLRDTESRVRTADLDSVMNPQRTVRDGAVLGGVAIIALVIVLAAPASAATGLMRILLPLGSAEWPARTGVASLMTDDAVHPRGQSLALRAEGTKAPLGAVDAMDIRAHYRLHQDGRYSSWRNVMLASQGSGRYERLIDTDAEAIEFYFSSDDSRTEAQTIRFVPPPAVRRAVLEIVPPGYALDVVGRSTIDLGPGLDERAISDDPSLIGSRLTIRFELNKAIPIPAPDANPAGDAQNSELHEWLVRTLGWNEGAVRVAASADQRAGMPALPQLTRGGGPGGGMASTFEIAWRLEGTTSLALHLVDEFGLSNVENIAYRIDAVADRPPSVTITKPESDQPVLRSAIVPLEAEARDDVAVAGMGLEMHRPGDAEPASGERLWRQWIEAQGTIARIARDLDLSRFTLNEGEVLEVSAIANDTFYLDGERHEQVRSAVRRLRIISEREFGESLLRELKALRDNAIRLEGQQAELQDDVIEDGVHPGVRQAQDRIGERLAEQVQSLRRLQDRREMNRFEDGVLESLLEQADDLLRHAGAASNAASAAIEQRERAAGASEATESPAEGDRPDDPTSRDPDHPTDPESEPESTQPAQGDTAAAAGEQADPGSSPLEMREPAEEDREIVERQQQVRDELRDLIEALDRNEDTWVMQQRIRDLLDQQTQLQSETQELAQQTRGRSLSELSQEELSELDRIAQRQQELAQRTRDLTDDLRDRANDLEQVDPQAAEAQRRAADVAEQREIDREMEQAASSAQENRLQNAQNSQQRARDAFENMLDEIDRRRAEAEELHRRLQSLIESIKRLVTIQENEINALARAVAESDFSGRDRAMIRLNQNTQAVASEARSAGRDTARIARALDRAADAQGASVGHLRASPVAAEPAETAQRRSLELLREALALAEELEEQVEQQIVQERRDELLRAYSELMERELALRGSTLELQQLESLGRRELVEARRYSGSQEDIRSALDRVRAETREISDSMIFSHVHELIDEWAREVVEALRDGDVSVRITDRQLTIADSIARLMQALEEEQSEPDEFEEDGEPAGGEGEGQSQPQPLVPPIAELRLLRGMQEQIYDQTRLLDAREDLIDADRRPILRELGRRQQTLQELGSRMLEQLQNQNMPPQGEQGGPQ